MVGPGTLPYPYSQCGWQSVHINYKFEYGFERCVRSRKGTVQRDRQGRHVSSQRGEGEAGAGCRGHRSTESGQEGKGKEEMVRLLEYAWSNKEAYQL